MLSAVLNMEGVGFRCNNTSDICFGGSLPDCALTLTTLSEAIHGCPGSPQVHAGTAY
jgi:hypothetical protein